MTFACRGHGYHNCDLGCCVDPTNGFVHVRRLIKESVRKNSNLKRQGVCCGRSLLILARKFSPNIYLPCYLVHRVFWVWIVVSRAIKHYPVGGLQIRLLVRSAGLNLYLCRTYLLVFLANE